jgi:hypothetical protein
MKMMSLSVVITNGDNCWPDLRTKGFVEGQWVGIARLPNGTVSGNATVTVRIELPDGRTVLAETTLALLRNALIAFEAAP